LIALNKEDKAKGRYTRIDSIQIGLLCVLTVLAGDFAMLVFDFMLL
jgi:hypothetical protein